MYNLYYMKVNFFLGVVSVFFNLVTGNLIDIFEQWAAKHNINIDDNYI